MQVWEKSFSILASLLFFLPSLFWVLYVFLAFSILDGGGEISIEVLVGSQAFLVIEAVCTECNALTSQLFDMMLFLWGNVLFSLFKEDLNSII